MITLLKNQYVRTSIGYCLLGLGLVFAGEPRLYSLAFSLGACLTMMILTWFMLKLGLSAVALQIASIITFAYGTFRDVADFIQANGVDKLTNWQDVNALARHFGITLIIVGAVFLTVALKRIAENKHPQ